MIRSRDRAEHTFTWRAFRPSVMTLGSGGPQTLEIAGSFLVATNRAHQYNVFFASAVFAGQYEQFVQPLRDSWNTFVSKRFDALMRTRSDRSPGCSKTLFSLRNYSTRSSQPVTRQIFTRASRTIFSGTPESTSWSSPSGQNGRPELLIRRWRYTLTAQDEQAPVQCRLRRFESCAIFLSCTTSPIKEYLASK